MATAGTATPRAAGSGRLFIAIASLVYTLLTLFVVTVAVYAFASDFAPGLLSRTTLRWLREMRDMLEGPVGALLAPLGALPGGTFLQLGLPIALNAWVFVRALRTRRARRLSGAWPLLNGYVLVLSFVCLGASLAVSALFLVMLLAFGIPHLLGALFDK